MEFYTGKAPAFVEGLSSEARFAPPIRTAQNDRRNSPARDRRRRPGESRRTYWAGPQRRSPGPRTLPSTPLFGGGAGPPHRPVPAPTGLWTSSFSPSTSALDASTSLLLLSGRESGDTERSRGRGSGPTPG